MNLAQTTVYICVAIELEVELGRSSVAILASLIKCPAVCLRGTTTGIQILSHSAGQHCKTWAGGRVLETLSLKPMDRRM